MVGMVRVFMVVGLFAVVLLAPTVAAEAGALAAQAQAVENGVLVSWTLVGAEAAAFTISRSQNGGTLAPIGTVSGQSSSYVDTAGVLGDVYVVTAAVGETVQVSNPAIATVDSCVAFIPSFPYVHVSTGCATQNCVLDSPFFPYVIINLNCLPV